MEDPDAPKFALMAATHKNAALSLLPSLVGVSDAHLLGIGLLTMFTLCSSLRGPAPTIFSMLKTIHNIWHGMQGYTFADQSLKVLDWVHLLNNLPDNPNDPFPIHLFSIHLPTSDFPDPEEVEDPEVADAYKSAVDALCTARPFSYSGYELIAAIKWAELFSTKFLELLLEKRPRALVILYHYCSMIHNVSYCWWAGDTEGRLNYVRELLDDKWKDCLDTIRSPFVEVASISSGFLTRPVY
ncbi:hypothetical protein VNI00_009856 [Paramarasmius palmivorus]|uniref:Uncharacterized protein n=1 Tax=Paramarasmius palmivorus TaxID=297713 RepID=A0AAW0CP77_9AGAR